MKLKTIIDLPPFFMAGEILSKEEWANRLNLSEETIDIMNASLCQCKSPFMEDVSDDIDLVKSFSLRKEPTLLFNRIGNPISYEEMDAIITNIKKAFPNLNDLLKHE